MEKWVKLGKIGHSYKNSQTYTKWDRKWVTRGNWVTLGKKGSHLEVRVTLVKMVTLGNVGHTWKKGSHLKNGSHLEKWVTLENVGHTLYIG